MTVRLAKTAEPIEKPFLQPWGSRNHYYISPRHPYEMGAMSEEVSGPLKGIESLYCVVHSKGNHSVLNNGVRADNTTASVDFKAPDWLVSNKILPH